MFHEMQRKDRELEPEAARSILEKGEYGILSTVGADGEPYGVPVNYACEGNKIYFHCAPERGHKLENIKSCPQVCFTVVGKAEALPADFSTKYESVIVFGRAEEAEDKERALELLIKKYSPEYYEEGMAYIQRAAANTGVYAIAIEHMTGKGRK